MGETLGGAGFGGRDVVTHCRLIRSVPGLSIGQIVAIVNMAGMLLMDRWEYGATGANRQKRFTSHAHSTCSDASPLHADSISLESCPALLVMSKRSL